MNIIKIISIAAIALSVSALSMLAAGMESDSKDMKESSSESSETATFAGGCFWCIESPYDGLPGVKSAVSGYTGGFVENPTYKQVCTGKTGHTEAVKVTYDPSVISYRDLLEVFWRSMDPTDGSGQFADRGSQYRPVIFYHSHAQKRAAMESREALSASGRFKKPIIVPVLPAQIFYPAEEYHQNYCTKQPTHYNLYKKGSGREGFLEKVWGKDLKYVPKGPEKKEMEPEKKYSKPSDKELKSKLSQMEYQVTQRNGTEPSFRNKYWNNKKPGIYVDIVSGEPLFSSTDKFKSGTGWPSFIRPLVKENVIEKEDHSLFMKRVEVRSKHGDSHLGHVFPDGPKPTGMRYCINSASLRFIPAADLEKEGYGEFSHLFKK